MSMTMNTKFEVGDKVKQSAVWFDGGLNPRIFVGEVSDVHPNGFYPYTVKLTVSGKTWWFREEELELAE